MYAVLNKRDICVSFLKDKENKIYDNNDYTALMYSAKTTYVKGVSLLVDYESKICNRYNEFALLILLRNSHYNDKLYGKQCFDILDKKEHELLSS